MNTPDPQPDDSATPPHYRWPKYVLGLVILGIVLAVIWVRVAVVKIEQQRDVNAPLPSSAPVTNR